MTATAARILPTPADPVTVYNHLGVTQTPQMRADPFAAHVFACTLTAAIIEAEDNPQRVSSATGLDRMSLAELTRIWAPGAQDLIDLPAQLAVLEIDEEEAQLLALLTRFRSDDTQTTQFITRIVTRRAMAPNHLWQDLGLLNRGELSQLITRWFPALAAENIENMKWKKFFYRQICALEGFSLCAAPTCCDCNDFNNCFGDEDGESTLAQLRR